MTGRALAFGGQAAAYERFRLGYPERVATDVLAYAGRPVRTALEIGAGTGKATRLFASRGVRVTATEPDAAMITQLRAQALEGVTIVQAAFEQLAPGRRYDLVYAAAALHWTAPEGRWSRIARMLAPGGVVACFGGPVRLTDPDVDAAVRAARMPWLPDDDVASPDGTPPTDPLQWPGTELVRSELFADVRQSTTERRIELSSQDFVGHLSTVSAYLGLPEVQRRTVLDRIRAVLPPEVGVAADVVLHTARRA